MTKLKDLDVLFTVEVYVPNHSRDYIIIEARPVYRCFDEERERQSFRRFNEHALSWQEKGLADLCLYGQCSAYDLDSVYAWDRIIYDKPHAVSLQRAEAMVRTLRHIERKLENMRLRLGFPSSFGQQLARLGSIYDATGYGFWPPSGKGTWASGDTVRWVEADDIDTYVQGRIKDIRTCNGVTVAA